MHMRCELHVPCTCTACALEPMHAWCIRLQARGPRLLAAGGLCPPRNVGGVRGGGGLAGSNTPSISWLAAAEPATHAPRHPPVCARQPSAPQGQSLGRVLPAVSPWRPLSGGLLGAAHSRWLCTPGAALCEHPRRCRSACGSSRHMAPSRTGEQPSNAATLRPALQPQLRPALRQPSAPPSNPSSSSSPSSSPPPPRARAQARA